MSGGASAQGAAVALDSTFLAALHGALFVSGRMAAAGAVTSVAGRLRAVRPAGVERAGSTSIRLPKRSLQPTGAWRQI